MSDDPLSLGSCNAVLAAVLRRPWSVVVHRMIVP
jgi:hypothetical protein